MRDMIYGYARVSTDGQSVDAQMRQLTEVGCEEVFREVASGARTDREQLRRLLDGLAPGDVLTVNPPRPAGTINAGSPKSSRLRRRRKQES